MWAKPNWKWNEINILYIAFGGEPKYDDTFIFGESGGANSHFRDGVLVFRGGPDPS